MSDSPAPQQALDTAREHFVRDWGALAHVWGISRSMGEIHALLYTSPEPLCTDDIMARLRISRGGANQNLRALEEWRLVRRVHRPGDRRDYFEAEGEAWAVLWILVDERKRREVDPLIAVLRACVAEAPPGDEAASELYRDRLNSLLSLLEEMDGLYQRLHALLRDSSPEVLRQVARL